MNYRNPHGNELLMKQDLIDFNQSIIFFLKEGRVKHDSGCQHFEPSNWITKPQNLKKGEEGGEGTGRGRGV